MTRVHRFYTATPTISRRSAGRHSAARRSCGSSTLVAGRQSVANGVYQHRHTDTQKGKTNKRNQSKQRSTIRWMEHEKNPPDRRGPPSTSTWTWTSTSSPAPNRRPLVSFREKEKFRWLRPLRLSSRFQKIFQLIRNV